MPTAPDGRQAGVAIRFASREATENAVILNGRIHKLSEAHFDYDPADFMRPWHMKSPDERLDLEFVPFYDRTAETNMGIITSEVHQMFGHYQGQVTADDGEVIRLDGITGFAEEHHARW